MESIDPIVITMTTAVQGIKTISTTVTATVSKDTDPHN